ncbi:hypothetical protein LTR95_017726 [Oleoguttula sp. CCFEE 5521]
MASETAMEQNNSDAAKVTWSRFNEKRFSDVVVKFGERTVYALKVILCRGLEYFSKLFDNFQEASQSEITLHDDDPGAVTSMLYHLYSIDYTPLQRPPSIASGLLLTMQVFATADKYCVGDLQRNVRMNISSALHRLHNRDRLVAGEVHEPMRAAFKGTIPAYTDIRKPFRSFCAKNIHALRASSMFTDLLADVPELCLSLVLEGEDEVHRPAVSALRCVECNAAITRDTMADQNLPISYCRCGDPWPGADEVNHVEFEKFIKEFGVLA